MTGPPVRGTGEEERPARDEPVVSTAPMTGPPVRGTGEEEFPAVSEVCDRISV